MSTAVVRPERASDHDSVRAIHRAAFAGDAESRLVDALRSAEFHPLSLVAECEGRVVGHILFSRIQVLTPAGTLDATSLAPLAVLPAHQRQAIGSQLVAAGLEACRAAGHRFVVVLGHPAFYTRFGFSAQAAQPLSSPFGVGESWMALELVPGALAGVTGLVEYPAPFSDL